MGAPLYDRDTVLGDLRLHVLTVTFSKEDGSPRQMRCTLRPDLMPKTYLQEEEQAKERSFHAEHPENIAAWDLQAPGWRSFKISTVKYLEVTQGYEH